MAAKKPVKNPGARKNSGLYTLVRLKKCKKASKKTGMCPHRWVKNANASNYA